jgi:hypothetical protein
MIPAIFKVVLVCGLSFSIAILGRAAERAQSPLTPAMSGSGNGRPQLRTDTVEPISVTVEKPAEFEVVFDVRYEATGEGCDKFNVFQWIETSHGATNPTFDDIYTVHAGQTSLAHTIPIDRYIPGRCKWRPVMLFVDLSDMNHPAAAGAYSRGGVITIGDFGVSSVALNQTCTHTVDTKSAVVRLRCVLSRGEFAPRALKPSGSSLKIKYSLDPGS